MSESESCQSVHVLATFEDLNGLSDEVLRHLASRVHVSELAYAFGAADPALRQRLLKAVRPGLAADIQLLIDTIAAESARMPADVQARSAQARLLDLARSVVQERPAVQAASKEEGSSEETTKPTKAKGK